MSSYVYGKMSKKLFLFDRYDSGKLKTVAIRWKKENGFWKWLGIMFYSTGKIKCRGLIQRGGLYNGKWYYPCGALMFNGKCNERELGDYYGPPYPVSGSLYTDNGSLICTGKIPHSSRGNASYPRIETKYGTIHLG